MFQRVQNLVMGCLNSSCYRRALISRAWFYTYASWIVEKDCLWAYSAVVDKCFAISLVHLVVISSEEHDYRVFASWIDGNSLFMSLECSFRLMFPICMVHLVVISS